MAKSNPPLPVVLGEIKKLLVTKAKDPFDPESFTCLGVTNEKRRCNRTGSTKEDREASEGLVEYFGTLQEIPHNDDFYEKVRIFLHAMHCRDHVKVVMLKFEEWKTSRTSTMASFPRSAIARGKRPAQSQKDPYSSGSGGNHESGSNASRAGVSTTDTMVIRAVRRVPGNNTNSIPAETAHSSDGLPLRRKVTSGDVRPKTPVKAVHNPAMPVAVIPLGHREIDSDGYQSSIASPNDESDATFSPGSPASTIATTPGSLFPDGAGSPLQVAEQSRPETPTPASRNAVAETMNASVDELIDEIKLENEDLGPEILGGIDRRFKSQRRHKWPLLHAIEKRFTNRDLAVGKVYIFKHTESDRLIKIGWTTYDGKKRHSDRDNCAAIKTTVYWDSPVAFKGAYRVEQITHKQLQMQNIQLRLCRYCEGSHTEWFEMDPDEARRILEGWTMFVTGGAYGEDGRLSEAGRQFLDEAYAIQPRKFVKFVRADAQTKVSGSTVVDELRYLAEDDEGLERTEGTRQSFNVVDERSTEEPSSAIDTTSIFNNDSPEKTTRKWKRRVKGAGQRVLKGLGLSDKPLDGPTQQEGRLKNDEAGKKVSRRDFLLFIWRFYSTELKEAEEELVATMNRRQLHAQP